MDTLGDTWALGPKNETLVTPPRPDLPGLAVQTQPEVIGAAVQTWATVRPTETFQTAPPWKRVGAVLGVVWSFFFFLTIPGWLALGRYKKWKAGDIPTPHLLIGWGYCFLGLLLLVVLSDLSSTGG